MSHEALRPGSDRCVTLRRWSPIKRLLCGLGLSVLGAGILAVGAVTRGEPPAWAPIGWTIAICLGAAALCAPGSWLSADRRHVVRGLLVPWIRVPLLRSRLDPDEPLAVEHLDAHPRFRQSAWRVGVRTRSGRVVWCRLTTNLQTCERWQTELRGLIRL